MQADIDGTMVIVLLQELLDCVEGECRLSPLRWPLKHDEVALSHWSAQVESHVTRVELLADQLPLIASLVKSTNKVDLSLITTRTIVEHGPGCRLRGAPLQLHLETVSLLDRLTVEQVACFVEQKGDCLLLLKGNCNG